ncbi:SDR family oxidoreductase [Streptomyces sp. NPDC018972]|uniref:SDR family oxidoreductase n=1 Tax=Streptomyces sp. NPDC018972 TaxID=3365060 RepID=UPI0037BBB868
MTRTSPPLWPSSRPSGTPSPPSPCAPVAPTSTGRSSLRKAAKATRAAAWSTWPTGGPRSPPRSSVVANIRVNGIVPGSIDTPMIRILPKEPLDHFAQTVPMKRRGTAEEIANVITFLLSDEAPSYVSGAIVPVDGGWLATS